MRKGNGFIFMNGKCGSVIWGRISKKGKFYLSIDLKDDIYRMAILSQLRLLDAKRLYQKISVIDETTHELLEKRIITLCRGL